MHFTGLFASSSITCDGHSYHVDLKAANVLVDSNFCAKVSLSYADIPFNALHLVAHKVTNNLYNALRSQILVSALNRRWACLGLLTGWPLNLSGVCPTMTRCAPGARVRFFISSTVVFAHIFAGGCVEYWDHGH